MKKLIIMIGLVSGLIASTAHAESLGGHVRLLGGIGPTGVSTNRLMGTGNNVETKMTNDKVYGIGFDVNISPRVSIGAETLSNSTNLLSLGLSI